MFTSPDRRTTAADSVPFAPQSDCQKAARAPVLPDGKEEVVPGVCLARRLAALAGSTISTWVAYQIHIQNCAPLISPLCLPFAGRKESTHESDSIGSWNFNPTLHTPLRTVSGEDPFESFSVGPSPTTSRFRSPSASDSRWSLRIGANGRPREPSRSGHRRGVSFDNSSHPPSPTSPTFPLPSLPGSVLFEPESSANAGPPPSTSSSAFLPTTSEAHESAEPARQTKESDHDSS